MRPIERTHLFFEIQFKSFRYAGAIGRIGAEEMANGTELNLPRYLRHMASDIAEEKLLRVGRDEAEQVARLRVIVVAVAVIGAIGHAGNT